MPMPPSASTHLSQQLYYLKLLIWKGFSAFELSVFRPSSTHWPVRQPSVRPFLVPSRFDVALSYSGFRKALALQLFLLR